MVLRTHCKIISYSCSSNNRKLILKFGNAILQYKLHILEWLLILANLKDGLMLWCISAMHDHQWVTPIVKNKSKKTQQTKTEVFIVKTVTSYVSKTGRGVKMHLQSFIVWIAKNNHTKCFLRDTDACASNLAWTITAFRKI